MEPVPHAVVPLTLAHDGEGRLVVVELPDGRDHSSVATLAARHDARLEPWSDAEPSEARRQLEAYLAGERDAFDLPVRLLGTAFQVRVWTALLDIPVGETRSYGELAAALGRPGAARAVGSANGRNPIPIVVPCHRVVGADGSLTGFGGGLALKQWLLEHEGAELEPATGASPIPSAQLELGLR